MKHTIKALEQVLKELNSRSITGEEHEEFLLLPRLIADIKEQEERRRILRKNEQGKEKLRSMEIRIEGWLSHDLAIEIFHEGESIVELRGEIDL